MTKYFELNENKDTAYQDLQYVTKAVFRWKFIALNTLLEKKKDLKSMISLSSLKN